MSNKFRDELRNEMRMRGGQEIIGMLKDLCYELSEEASDPGGQAEWLYFRDKFTKIYPYHDKLIRGDDGYAKKVH